jgi:hypothetical protein
MVKAIDDCNIDDYLNLLHDDYVFVRHQSNQEVSKSEWIPVVTGMFNAMKEGKLNFENNRCLYENDDILVIHNIGNFPDNTKEGFKTEALPSIWENKDEFNALMKKASEDMIKLAKAIDTAEDLRAVQKELMWSNCSACHSRFRAPH